MRPTLLKTLSAFALMTALSACGPTEPAQSTAPPAPFNQPVTIDNVQIKLTSVEQRGEVGIEYAMERASDGATLVVVSYDTTNTGTAPVGMFEMPSIQLVDPEGTTYAPDLAKTSAFGMQSDLNEKILSDLNPGITTQGAQVFEVAATAFDISTWSAQIVGEPQRLALK